jgi:hypothetical protein
MPQIWMTYREIADMLGSDADAARAETIRRSLDRKKSRDGSTRAKLDLELTALFVAAIRDADPTLDQAIHDLRAMGNAMSRGRRPRTGTTVADAFDVAVARSQ